MKIKEITLLSMMSAIIFVAQVALRFIPNVELVSLLIILYTLVFKKKTLYIIYVFVILEGLLYGFGLWWFSYLYVWTILFIIVMIFRKSSNVFLWTIISGIYGLSFGAFFTIPYFFMGGFPSAFAYWVNGIPFDIIHCISNIIVTLILFKPLYSLINLINNRIINLCE